MSISVIKFLLFHSVSKREINLDMTPQPTPGGSECVISTAVCKMAEGVLPFVRGLDLTKNDFKVQIQLFYLLCLYH